MSHIVTIAGSPSSPSRSSAVLGGAAQLLSARGHSVSAINVRDLDAHDLLHARFEGESIRAALALVNAAHGVIVATPVYKAAYTGVLKAFLDLMPQSALAGKVVLPIALGGTPAHMLVIDYALRPVLNALGAYHVLNGVYLLDSQLTHIDGANLQFTASEAEIRFGAGIDALSDAVQRLVPDHSLKA